MKTFIRRKWFRVLMRTLVIVPSLVFLAVAVFNWHAAGQKKRAIAEAKTAGLALSVGDLMTGMPPDELNFARHGNFALIEDAFGVQEVKVSDEHQNAIESFEALGGDTFLYNLLRRPESFTGPVDFSLLPDEGGYGKTAASFLAEFDRRHATALDEIRSGMTLPYVRRRALPGTFAGGKEWIILSETPGRMIMLMQYGLTLRAEAAVAVGDIVKAVESVEMFYKLGELTGSRGFMMSAFVEFRTFPMIQNQVKVGMDRGLWTTEALDRISAAAARLDVRARIIQGTRFEAAIAQGFETLKHNREWTTFYLGAKVRGGMIDAFPATARIFPDGVFDRTVAAQLDELRSIVSLLQDPAPAAGWWNVAEELKRKSARATGISQLLNGAPALAAFLELGGSTLVYRQLILTACAIERHRLTHGAYPESLAGFPSEITSDPILGGTLRYERTEHSFRLYTPGPFQRGSDGKPDPHAKAWIW